MIKLITAIVVGLLPIIAIGQTVTDVETVTFDSGWQGLFDPSTEPNPYDINQGYSVPNIWNNGNPISFDQTFYIPSFGPVGIPSFGCSDLPGFAQDVLNAIGIPCSSLTFPGLTAFVGIVFDNEFTMEVDMDYVNFGDDSLQVVYPAEIDVEYPADLTFNAGEWVGFNTEYQLDTVNGNPQLNTVYPSTGSIESYLDMNYISAISFQADFNFFGSTWNYTYDIATLDLQDVLTNYVGFTDTRFPLFKVDEDTSFTWSKVQYGPNPAFADPNVDGPAGDNTGGGMLPAEGWFPAVQEHPVLSAVFPYVPFGPLNLMLSLPPFGYQTNLVFPAFPECGFWDNLAGSFLPVCSLCKYGQYYDLELPLSPSTGPISGNLTLPYVETTMTPVGNNLTATGDSTYTDVTLDLAALAAMIIDIGVKCPCIEDGCGTITPPYPLQNDACKACQPVKEAAKFILEEVLTNSVSIPIPGLSQNIDVSWTLLTAGLVLNLENNLNSSFTPTKVGARYVFPTPVDFEIFSGGVSYMTGSGTEISFDVGDSVAFEYPCFYEELEIEKFYSLEGDAHTDLGDNISLNAVVTAGGVDVFIPGFNLFGWGPNEYCATIPWPDICYFEICIPFLGCWNAPYICFPMTSFCLPAVSLDFPEIDINTCDLVYAPLGIPCDASSGAATVMDLNLLTFPGTTWHSNTWQLEGFTEQPSGVQMIMKTNVMVAQADSVTDVGCFGDATGEVEVSVTYGTQPYVTEWTDGTTYPASNGPTFTHSNLPADEYFVTITDFNGCETVTGGTVLQPTDFSISSNVTDADCFGSSTGDIVLNVMGATPVYSFLWNTGATSQNLSNLLNGTYDVVITDDNGCDSTVVFTIDEPTDFVMTSSSIQNVPCSGDQTGSVDVNVIGGTAPLTYQWYDSGGAPVGTGPSLQNVQAESYTLTVTDVKGCDTTFAIFPVTEPLPLDLTPTATDVLCFGDNSGTLNVTTNDGTPGYNYAWYDHTGGLTSNTANFDNALYSGNHTVIVTDVAGCKDTVFVFIDQPAELTITNVTIQDVDCFGDNTGQIDITPDGGIVGTYNYNWTTVGGSGLVPANEDQNALTAGSYTVTITDANLCTHVDSYTIDEPSAPIAITFNTVDVKCFGDGTGEIDVNVTGGTGPYTYAWTSGLGTGHVPGDEDQTGLTAATYDLTVTDSKGCTEVVSVVINQPTAPLALSETHADVLCYGGNDGSIDLTITGGTTPYSYQWSDGAFLVLTTTAEDLTTLTSDTYNVLVTDVNGCEAIMSILVDQPLAPLALSSVITDVDCNGNSTGSIDLSVTGGTTAYTYAWTTTSGSGLVPANEDQAGVTTGQYDVLVTDANGCQETHSAFVNEPTIPITPTVVTTAVLCRGDSTGSIDLDVIGGTAPYIYDWDWDGVGDNDDDQDLGSLPSGFYTVTITDTNGCTQSSGGFIDEPSMALTVTAAITEPSCFGYTDGFIDLTITGGTTPYYMEWGNDPQYLLNNPSELLNGLGKGMYFFRITDENECIYEEFVPVGQPDTLEVDMLITDVTCYGGSDGMIDLTPNGGTPPYSYVWSNASTAQNQTGLTTDDYSYVLTDVNGCTFTDEGFVDQSPDIYIHQEIIPLSCIDQLDAEIIIQTAGGMQPYTWAWSNGDNTEHLVNLGAGDYQVLIVDDFGCTKTFDFDISASETSCVNTPNSFTPNGDDYNDTWFIENIYLYPNAEVRIFNRWGNKIYETIGEYIPWDGRHKGQPLPSEVYYYVIELNNGVDNKYTGTVTIVR